MIPQENGIIVSAIEPIKNRRRIWMKKGKNLYNPETMPLMNGLWISGITNLVGNTSGWYVVVPITGGKTYTISKKNTRTEFSSLNFTIIATEKYPTNGTNILQISSNSSYLNEYTITAQANVKYLFIGLAIGTTLTDDMMAKAIEELQVEVSDLKTDYEAYIEPKIYVKNQAGVYEEFIKNGNDIITVENSNGTALLFPDGTMICSKTVNFQNININTAVGSLYKSSQLDLGNWAYEFIEKPTVSQAGVIGGWASWLYQYTNYNASSAGDATLIRPTSTTSSNSNQFTIGVMAIGRWK